MKRKPYSKAFKARVALVEATRARPPTLDRDPDLTTEIFLLKVLD